MNVTILYIVKHAINNSWTLHMILNQFNDLNILIITHTLHFILTMNKQ